MKYYEAIENNEADLAICTEIEKGIYEIWLVCISEYV